MRDVEVVLTSSSVSSVLMEVIKNVETFYGFDKDDIKAELRVFTNLVKEKFFSDDLDQSLNMISKRKQILDKDSALRTVLPTITTLMRIFWTVPVTSCSAEHSFSCLRRLKNYMRSTMGQERLSSLAFLNIKKEVSINIDEVIDEFASTSPHRLSLLY